METNKHRTISIMGHLTKIILRVCTTSIRNKIRSEFAVEQYGFSRDKGTINAIFLIRLAENRIEVKIDVYVCFVDYDKTFDTFNHKELLVILIRTRVDGRDVRITGNLYRKQEATVKLKDETSV